MEVNLKIYSNLSKKQYSFKRGSSTTAAVHKLVKKFEFAILNQGMALGTFLDIEGAFDNVSFDAIESPGPVWILMISFIVFEILTIITLIGQLTN